MSDPLSQLQWQFPFLASTGYKRTSDADSCCNCIAWAAGRTDSFWSPTPVPGLKPYWPPNVPRQLTLEAFVKAFESLGYVLCGDHSLQAGMEKVAIYARGQIPTHAARQLPNGCWTSKLGKNIDIEHNVLKGVEGPQYGVAVAYLERPRRVSAEVKAKRRGKS